MSRGNKLDFSFDQKVKDEAVYRAEQRFKAREPGLGEPTFTNARENVDRAEADAGRNATSLFDLPSSVRDRTNRARQRLRDNMNGMRSRGSKYFRDTVPAAPGETAARFLLAVDAGGNVKATDQPKTQLEVNVRPLAKKDDRHESSFHSAMAAFVAKSPMFKKELTKPPDAVAHVRLRLKDDSVKEDVLGRVQVAVMMTPLRDPNGPALLEYTFVEEADGKKFLDVRVAAKDLGGKDPAEKVIKGFALKVMKQRGGAMEKASLTDFFRLLSLRVDIPASIGEWLESDKSFLSLFEGIQVAVESVTRSRAQALAFRDLASMLLTDRGPRGSAGAGAAAAFAAGMSAESDVVLRIAPPELVFAQSVRDLGIAVRQFVRDSKEQEDGEEEDEEFGSSGGGSSGSADSKKKALDDFLSSTAVEDTIAACFGNHIKFGTSGKRAVDLALGALSGKLCENGEGPLPMLLPLKNMIQSVDSGHFISHSTETKATIHGIDNKLLSVVPDSAQGIVDRSKAWTLANYLEQMAHEEDPKNPTALLRKLADAKGGALDKEDYRRNPRPRDLLRDLMEQHFQGKMSLGISPKGDLRYGPPFPLAIQKPTAYGPGKAIWDWQFPKQMINPPKRKTQQLKRLMRGDFSAGGSGEKGKSASPPASAAAAAAGSKRIPTDDELRAAFAAADEDGSGVLENSEFFSVCLLHFPQASPSKLVSLHSQYDKNRDGVISFDEFKVLVSDACK